MVETEVRFAAHSVEHGTRAAFLAFMDTAAIMFEKGVAVKAYPMWEARPNNPGVLHWMPVINELAASGDWGFTLGPWTFQPRTEQDSVVARGHFITVWKRGADGSWKFIFDCGTDSGDESLHLLYTFNAPKTRGTVESLMAAERLLDGRLLLGDTMVRRRFRSPSSAFCREARPIALMPREQDTLLAALPARIAFSPVGHMIAPSGDLAVVYGTIAGASGKPEPYVRIWRHEAAGWKIAAELLRM
ncbi:hypothetical protein GCM10023184_12400 [Flaviaesturariibacter amylovorans]|uniref:DUF4440 domain-containing protein n=2 Tax=Flaviaesturariibacter amylovorans TaxID=1084520 RepID=A0ABP8GI48_9BACT